MALWSVKAGKHGEFESAFIERSMISATWPGRFLDLHKVANMAEMFEVMQKTYPDASPGRNRNHAGQLWAFSHTMKPGDLVAVPQKSVSTLALGEITGPYVYEGQGADPYQHQRSVKWLKTNLPRTDFDRDVLLSLGAIQTISQSRAVDAELRVRGMIGGAPTRPAEDPEPTSVVDFQEAARDQIADRIMARFKGHGLALLVEEILRCQGYFTYRSPEGPDKGIDLLAGTGPMGFGEPRICVQVKSGQDAVDSPALHQLIGAMSTVKATYGLFVSWGGFKSSVMKDLPSKFFGVRLWNQKDIIDQLLLHYEQLSDETRAELPLKRIWTLADEEVE